MKNYVLKRQFRKENVHMTYYHIIRCLPSSDLREMQFEITEGNTSYLSKCLNKNDITKC